MPIVAIIGAVVLAVGAAVLVPKALAASRLTASYAKCNALKARIAGARLQGGDLVLAAQLEAEYESCVAETNAMGGSIDVAGAQLDSIEAAGSQLAVEWTHYKSTADTDAVKRNNTRSAILRIGEDMVRELRGAVMVTTTLPVLDRIERFTREQALQSRARIMCWLSGEGGCSRYGVNEPHPNDNATDEIIRIGAPLGVVEMYGVEWSSPNGNHIGDVGGDTRAALRAIDGGSVLKEIAAKRAELTPAANPMLRAGTSVMRGAMIRL